MKQLPIGIQDFSRLIQGGYLYVDKTESLWRLIASYTACFLSRPRRFGKSLLISTLEEIFSANTDLFKGLWIEQSDCAWPKHPVVRIDFSKLGSQSAQTLVAGVNRTLKQVGLNYDVTLEMNEDIAYNISGLIDGLYRKTRSLQHW